MAQSAKELLYGKQPKKNAKDLLYSNSFEGFTPQLPDYIQQEGVGITSHEVPEAPMPIGPQPIPGHNLKYSDNPTEQGQYAVAEASKKLMEL